MIDLQQLKKETIALVVGCSVLSAGLGYLGGRQAETASTSDPEGTEQVTDEEQGDTDSSADSPSTYSLITTTTNPLTDTTKYSLTITASEPGYNSIGTREDPYIHIRCEAGDNDLYVATPEFLSSDSQTVQLRWDGGAPTPEYWTGSSGGTALFSNSPISTLQKLSTSDRLVIGYKPWRTVESAAVFSLEDSREDLKKMLEHCKQ